MRSVQNCLAPCRQNQTAAHRFAAAALAAALALFVGCGDKESEPLPDSGFVVAFESHNIAKEMKAGETVLADVTVKNISSATWPSKPNAYDQHAVNLSYHWLTRRGQMVVFDGIRTPLPHDVAPGESVALKVAIQPPDQPGLYTLEVTLVQEAVAWFPEEGGAKLTRFVKVVAGTAEGSAPAGAPDVAGGPVASDKNHKKPGELPAKRAGRPGQTAQTDRTPDSRDAQSGQWAVQVGSYPKKKEAESLAKKLRDKDYNAYVAETKLKEKSWHQVRVGGFASRGEANNLQDKLRAKEDLKQSFIVNVQ